MSLWIMTDRGWRPYMPSIKPCPNSNALEGVFQDIPVHVAERDNAARAERFCRALDEDQYGPKFRGKEFAEPIFGAFGERL